MASGTSLNSVPKSARQRPTISGRLSGAISCRTASESYGSTPIRRRSDSGSCVPVLASLSPMTSASWSKSPPTKPKYQQVTCIVERQPEPITEIAHRRYPALSRLTGTLLHLYNGVELLNSRLAGVAGELADRAGSWSRRVRVRCGGHRCAHGRSRCNQADPNSDGRRQRTRQGCR